MTDRVQFNSPVPMEQNGRNVRVLSIAYHGDEECAPEYLVEDEEGRQ